MINRLDNICEAVLKGKWPVNRRQMFDFQGLIPGYTPPAADSPLQKRSFAELSMVGQAGISVSEDLTSSPQLSKVGTSALFVQVEVLQISCCPGLTEKHGCCVLSPFQCHECSVPKASCLCV